MFPSSFGQMAQGMGLSAPTVGQMLLGMSVVLSFREIRGLAGHSALKFAEGENGGKENGKIADFKLVGK
ncbi:MAG: hypothetical protein IPM82_07810 [Saprospiraceae bacterium]|nr:hypothetical protein [Saprospiraceae bacterium]